MDINVSKLTFPLSMLTTIVGGAAWLTTTRGDVNHLQIKVDSHIQDFKSSHTAMSVKASKQGEAISEINAKLDLLLRQMENIQRKLERHHGGDRDREQRH